MSRRIPEDAFAPYYSLGLDRSYQSVAEEYGVSKQIGSPTPVDALARHLQRP